MNRTLLLVALIGGLLLLSATAALSQVQQPTLTGTLKGVEVVSTITIGDTGAPVGYNTPYPVNTLVYPDGQIIYRVEWGLMREQVGRMGKSFAKGTTFQITSVDFKDDRLELKLLGRNRDSGRLKVMLGAGWQTRMTNATVAQILEKYLRLPAAESVNVAPAAPLVAPLKLPSTYVNAQTSADQLQLNTDKTFSLQEGGQSYHGTFVVNGNTLELSISENSTKTTVSIQGNNLADSSGQTWVLR